MIFEELIKVEVMLSMRTKYILQIKSVSKQFEQVYVYKI